MANDEGTPSKGWMGEPNPYLPAPPIGYIWGQGPNGPQLVWTGLDSSGNPLKDGDGNPVQPYVTNTNFDSYANSQSRIAGLNRNRSGNTAEVDPVITDPSDPRATSIPTTGIYKEKQAIAQKAYNDAKAILGNKQGQLLREYGYTASIDPTTGVASNYQLDANNPYGQFQRSSLDFTRQYNIARDDAVGRGLGTTGLGAKNTTGLRQDHEYNQAKIGRDFLSRMLDIDVGRMSAQQDLATSMLSAQQESIQNALQQKQYGAVPYAAPTQTNTAKEKLTLTNPNARKPRWQTIPQQAY